MSARAPLLWLPIGLLAGVILGVLAPLPFDVPLAVLLVLHAIAIGHLALSLPLLSVGRAVWSRQVWGALLAVNLLLIPILVFVLSRVVWHTPEMQVGVLMVLLAPGVAISLPIIRGAGGDAESVLAGTPLLVAGQLLVVPIATVVFSGGAIQIADLLPTVLPVALVIVVPFLVALGIQAWSRRHPAPLNPFFQQISRWSIWWAALAFFVTAWERTPEERERLIELSWVIPLSIAFLVLVAPLSLLASSLAGVSVDKRRAILIQSVGRGGMVIVPITLLLDAELWGLVPFVVMLQASIEAIGLLVYRSITPEILEDPRRQLRG